MGKTLLMLCLFIFSSSVASATDLVDTLNKKFKKISFPHEEVTAKITIVTPVIYLKGNKKEHDAFRALQVHEKLVSIFKQNGWEKDNQLLTDVIDAGEIELEIGEGMTLKFDKTFRLKAFVHQCDSPMTKYRGGDINEFFTKNVLEEAEECFTYEEKLQGKNYPY